MSRPSVDDNPYTRDWIDRGWYRWRKGHPFDDEYTAFCSGIAYGVVGGPWRQDNLGGYIAKLERLVERLEQSPNSDAADMLRQSADLAGLIPTLRALKDAHELVAHQAQDV